MTSDAELLQQYRTGSALAFETLVRRHVDWIYSAALRRMSDRQLAEDVTQVVFIALFQKAQPRHGEDMSAWLFAVMRHASANLLRSETRRRQREMEAARARPEAQSGEEWPRIAPLLDEAVAQLSARDRRSVLLRFYQRLTWAQLAEALGISEEGARKRTSRAIAKLRDILAARGISMPSDALAGELSANAVGAAAASLASRVAGGASGQLSRMARRAAGAASHSKAHPLAAMLLLAAVLGGGAIWLLKAPSAASTGIGPPTLEPAAQNSPSADEAEAATRPADLTLPQIVAGIRASQNQFQNLYIRDFVTTCQTRATGSTAWKPSPQMSAGSAWFDGQPRGKKRIYYADQVSPWINGTAPWAESVMDVSWDGTQERQLRVHDYLASIVPKPFLLASRGIYVETGLAFTAQYWTFDPSYTEWLASPKPRRPLADQIDDLPKWASFTIEVAKQKVHGFDAVRVRAIQSHAQFSYWFVPSHNFAVAKWTMVLDFPNVKSSEGIDVLELKQVAPGAWFPLRAVYTNPNPGYPPFTEIRYNFQAADVTANDPKFDPSIFCAPIPAGFIVADDMQSVRRSYIQLKDGSQIELHAGSLIPRIDREDATRPDQ